MMRAGPTSQTDRTRKILTYYFSSHKHSLFFVDLENTLHFMIISLHFMIIQLFKTWKHFFSVHDNIGLHFSAWKHIHFTSVYENRVTSLQFLKTPWSFISFHKNTVFFIVHKNTALYFMRTQYFSHLSSITSSLHQ